MRIYEFSKLVDVTSKELLDALQEAGYGQKTHMAVLSDEELSFLEKTFGSDKELKVKKHKPKKEAKGAEQEQGAASEELIIEAMTPGDFAHAVRVPVQDVILTLLKSGIVAPKNRLLDEPIIQSLAVHYQISYKKPEIRHEEKKEIFISESADIKKRPPIIVVLGHVDHGKTTLLDFIRKTRVASREKGGITQHLGAYSVDTKHGGIIFIDTPGHEAFTKIRARGVKTADVAIIVVAADDGLMPQTIEAINFAKQMHVPIIVAINKIDKMSSPQRLEVVKRQLAEQDLLPEEWGGQVVVVPISAKEGTNVDQLLEMIDLQAQLMDLEADVAGPAKGYVLESKLEKGRGAVATVILQQGHLRIGDYFVSGDVTGRVSSLNDSFGRRLKEFGPAHPVQVAGFSDLANAGDLFEAVDKTQLRKAKARVAQPVKVVYKEKAINLLVKADSNSSKEALVDAIEKLSRKTEHADFHIVQASVGDVNESDVTFASHTGAMIYGLHVKTGSGVQTLAKKEQVHIELHDIIYKLLESLQERAEKEKEVKMIDKKIGEAVIRKVFDIKKVGVIAGCYVQEGIFSAKGKVVVWRRNQNIGEGAITSLQREGKTVKEVHTGFECAFMAQDLTDFAVDDRVECYISVPETA